MNTVRAVWKLFLFSVTTLPVFSTYLLSQFLLRPFPRARARAHDTLVRNWARISAWTLSMKIRVEGVPPKPPFFLVCNHLSYVDVIALLTCTRGTFVAKSEIAGWPLLGVLARGVGTLFIDRTKKRDLVRVSELLRQELRDGRGIVIFPEATSSSGDAILPFKASTFEVPIEFDLPVHCAALRYETPLGCPAARMAVCWWGDMRFMPHLLEMAALPEYTARIRFGATAVRAADRKTLAATAAAEVTALHAELATRMEYAR